MRNNWDHCGALALSNHQNDQAKGNEGVSEDGWVMDQNCGHNMKKRAFTLIEMITVMVIILIILAIAVPVWDALMNGTNLVAAQNQIAAYIANARADAIYNRQMIGVFFYIDSKTQQEAIDRKS